MLSLVIFITPWHECVCYGQGFAKDSFPLLFLGPVIHFFALSITSHWFNEYPNKKCSLTRNTCRIAKPLCALALALCFNTWAENRLQDCCVKQGGITAQTAWAVIQTSALRKRHVCPKKIYIHISWHWPITWCWEVASDKQGPLKRSHFMFRLSWKYYNLCFFLVFF